MILISGRARPSHRQAGIMPGGVSACTVSGPLNDHHGDQAARARVKIGEVRRLNMVGSTHRRDGLAHGPRGSSRRPGSGGAVWPRRRHPLTTVHACTPSARRRTAWYCDVRTRAPQTRQNYRRSWIELRPTERPRPHTVDFAAAAGLGRATSHASPH